MVISGPTGATSMVLRDTFPSYCILHGSNYT